MRLHGFHIKPAGPTETRTRTLLHLGLWPLCVGFCSSDRTSRLIKVCWVEMRCLSSRRLKNIIQWEASCRFSCWRHFTDDACPSRVRNKPRSHRHASDESGTNSLKLSFMSHSKDGLGSESLSSRPPAAGHEMFSPELHVSAPAAGLDSTLRLKHVRLFVLRRPTRTGRRRPESSGGFR